MSVMFPRYFGIPQEVIRSGDWAQMKPTEKSVYVYLLHQSERLSTRKFIAKDADIEHWCGNSPRATRDARIKLQERGLIDCKAGRGHIYTYTICDPKTRLPYPGDPKVRVTYTRKREQPVGQQTSASVAR